MKLDPLLADSSGWLPKQSFNFFKAVKGTMVATGEPRKRSYQDQNTVTEKSLQISFRTDKVKELKAE